jgi:ribokinase
MGNLAAVLSAGTVNADFVLRVGVPVESGASLIAERLLRTSGGRAGNVAVMARRRGSPALLFGCVGSDGLAEQALAGPRAAGVELGAVRRTKGDTGLATILVDARAAKTMILAPGANDEFSLTDGENLAAAVSAAAERSVLVMDSEVSPAALVPALDAARGARRVVVLDPSRPKSVTDQLLKLVDHVTPNADEASQLTGMTVDSPADASCAARRLRERGPRHVHVRLRDGGCLSLWPEGEALLYPPRVDAVDTTGAGDAFAGTLASAIAAGRTPVDATRFAVAAAACAVTGFGAQESYPGSDVLDAMTREVKVAMNPPSRRS